MSYFQSQITFSYDLKKYFIVYNEDHERFQNIFFIVEYYLEYKYLKKAITKMIKYTH